MDHLGVRSVLRAHALVITAGAAACLAIGALAILRSPGLWFDEAYSVTIASGPVGSVLSAIGHQEVNNGLYYLVLHVWIAPGEAIWWVRSLSVLCGLLTVVALAWTAAIARSPVVVRTSVLAFPALYGTWLFLAEARGAMLAALLATCLVGTHLRALEQPTRRRCAGVVAWSVALVATAVLGLVLVACLAVRVTVRPDRRVAAAHALAVVGGGLVWALALHADTGQVWWIPATTGAGLFLTLLYLLGSGASVVLVVLLVLAFLALLGTGRVAVDRAGRRLAGAAAAWAVAVPVIVVALSALRPLVVGRYFVFCLPGLALALGCLAGAAPLLARITALSLVAVVLVAPHGRPPFWVRQEDLTGAAALIAASARPGDAMDVMATEIRPAVDHYVDRSAAGRELLRVGRTPGAAPWAPGGEMSRVVVPADFEAGLEAATGRLWVVLRSVQVSGDPLLDVVLARDLARRPLLEDRSFGLVEVRLYGPRDR